MLKIRLSTVDENFYLQKGADGNFFFILMLLRKGVDGNFFFYSDVIKTE